MIDPSWWPEEDEDERTDYGICPACGKPMLVTDAQGELHTWIDGVQDCHADCCPACAELNYVDGVMEQRALERENDDR